MTAGKRPAGPGAPRPGVPGPGPAAPGPPAPGPPVAPTIPQRGLREDLFAEMAGRLAPAEESARWRQGAFWYFTRTAAGQQLEQFCRAADREGPGEVLLDNNLLLDDPACAGSYAELGVREVS